MAHNFSSVEAGKAENRELNRYRDVYPYDHSRVTIRDLSATDYINASLVKVKKQRGRIGGRGRFPGWASQIIACEKKRITECFLVFLYSRNRICD